MKILFVCSKTFITREIINALKKRTDIFSVIVDMPFLAVAPEIVDNVFNQIKPHLPAIVFTVNNAGTDYAGAIAEKILKTGSYLLNWYTDDPFYESLFFNRKMTPDYARRIDFVTEASYVVPMRTAGFNAHFLPLAVDPVFFNTHNEVSLKRDVAFVGNSSLEFLDSVISEPLEKELTRFAALVSDAMVLYKNNPQTNIESYLLERKNEWETALTVTKERFLFSIVWLIGYIYRRDSIVALAEHFKERFTCFGDGYWGKFINPARVLPDACYYTTLCESYRSTRVNINFNRIQIRTSFTQRVFDCSASGAFLLCEARALNKKFFITEGSAQELVEFSSVAECIKKAEYYCTHENEAREIAERAKNKVLAGHTYDHRIDLMLSICKKCWQKQ